MSFSIQIIGSSSAVPNSDSATSCYVVDCDDTIILMECGHGAVGKLLSLRDPAELDAVVVSHMHPDHCIDLIALRNYIYTRDLPRVDLYLPKTGPESLRALAAALPLGEGYFDRTFRMIPISVGQSMQIGACTMESMASHHNTDGHMLRLTDSRGRRLVFSSDTATFPDLIQFAEECDLLLIEATDPVTTPSEPRWHLGWSEIADVLRQHRPTTTLLTHFDDRFIDETIARVRAAAPGVKVLTAKAGEVHELE